MFTLRINTIICRVDSIQCLLYNVFPKMLKKTNINTTHENVVESQDHCQRFQVISFLSKFTFLALCCFK